MGGGKGPGVQVAREDLLKGRLLVEVEEVLESVEAPGSRPRVVRVPGNGAVLVDVVLRDVIGTGRGNRRELLGGRQRRRDGAEERHRQQRQKLALALEQVDRQR